MGTLFSIVLSVALIPLYFFYQTFVYVSPLNLLIDRENFFFLSFARSLACLLEMPHLHVFYYIYIYLLDSREYNFIRMNLKENKTINKQIDGLLHTMYSKK